MSAARKKKLSLKTRRKWTRYAIGVLSTVAVVSVLVFVISGLRLPEVNISHVEISGTHYSDRALVHRAATNLLNGSYLFVVPRTSAFLYPRGKIQKEVLSLFPQVKEVHVARDGFTRLSVAVTEHAPHARWCESFSTTSLCFLINDEGYVFFKAGNESSVGLTYTGDIEGSPIGKTFLGGDYQKLSSFVGDLAEVTGRTPIAAAVDEHGDITVSFVERGELYFVKNEADVVLLDNIASVFASRRFATDEVLEYADFRFGNKVYVKFIEE